MRSKWRMRAKATDEWKNKEIPFPEGPQQLLALVAEIKGNLRFGVRCCDGVTRLARLRGNLRRGTWVVKEGLVLVAVRADFTVDDKCDIIHVYRDADKDTLHRGGYEEQLGVCYGKTAAMERDYFDFLE